ncbi:MAG: tetratricopeptide repeat protein [Candidatus Bipolaricaulia bacterium]
MTNAHLKGWIVAGIAAIAAVLILVLAILDQQTGIYVTVLIAGSLGLLIGTLPRARLGLTTVFLFLQPLVIYLPNTEYGYTKAILSLLAISLLWALWAGRWIWEGEARLRLTPLVWPFLGVLGAALLSLINANTLWGDIQYVVLIVYFAAFALYVAHHIERRGDVELVVGTVLGAAGLASVYGLLQYFGVVLGAPGESGDSEAIISTFGNRNYLGGFLAYLVAPGLWLLLTSRWAWVRGYVLGVLALVTATLVTIDSDSSWLAYVLSIATVIAGLVATGEWAILKRTWRWSVGLVAAAFGLTFLLHVGTELWLEDDSIWLEGWQDLAPVVGWAGLLTLAGVPLAGLLERIWEAPLRQRLAALAGAAVLAVLFLLSPPGQTAVSDIRQVATSGSAQIRAWDWWVGWHMVEDHPAIGIGIGDYKREFLPYKAEFLQTERGQYFQNQVGYIKRAAQAHNEYVQIAAEMGAVGILATLVLIVVLVGTTGRRIRQAEAPWQRMALLAFLGGIVAFLSDSFFSFPLHLPANALALVTLIGVIHSPVFGPTRPQPRLGRTAAQVTAGVVLAMALGVSVFAYRDWRADVLLDAALTEQQRSGNSAEVESLFRQSAELAVAPGQAYYWLGVISANDGERLTAEGKSDQARRQFERARRYLETALNRYNTENVYFELARSLERLGNYEQSERYLRTLIQMDPSDDLKRQARQLRALILYQQGQPEEALSIMRNLGDAHPRSPHIQFTLAQMLADRASTLADEGKREAAQANVDEARAILERALETVNQRLRTLERKLNPDEDTSVPLSKYSEWRSQRDSLQRLRSNMRQLLDRLGP